MAGEPPCWPSTGVTDSTVGVQPGHCATCDSTAHTRAGGAEIEMVVEKQGMVRSTGKQEETRAEAGFLGTSWSSPAGCGCRYPCLPPETGCVFSASRPW